MPQALIPLSIFIALGLGYFVGTMESPKGEYSPGTAFIALIGLVVTFIMGLAK